MNIQDNKRSNDGNLPIQPPQKIQNLGPRPFKTLPKELIVHIFSFLNIVDLANISSVNKSWSQIANDNVLWKKFAETFAKRVDYRVKDSSKKMKSQITPKYVDLVEKIKENENDLPDLRPLIPCHLMKKPTTILKLLHLNAWLSALRPKILRNCILQFEANEPDINPDDNMYTSVTKAFYKVENESIKRKMLAEFVINYNIIGVWSEIAQKAGIQMTIDHNLVKQPDSKRVNSLFNQWIDDNLEAIQKIETLKLSRLGLIMLPDGLKRLENLKVLDISVNSLHFIPHWIGNLTKLEHLLVNTNALSFLPWSMKNLTSLKKLHLHINKFTGLPDGLQHLENLEELKISKNLHDIRPPWIGKLTKLKTCSLLNNAVDKDYDAPLSTRNRY